jgi:cytochrome c-type biogenesis protein CcmH
VSAGAASSIPQGGVLYLVIRAPGPAVGPPIGVRRIIGPKLPLEITISDQDSMLKERQISSESEVQLQARISLTGSPGAQTGDWQSEQVTVTLDSAKNVELVIDQRVE